MNKLTSIALAVAIVIVMLPCASAFAEEEKLTLEQLRAIADASNGERCAEYCLDLANVLVEHANQLFADGNPEQGQAEIKSAVNYARKAADGSIQARRREKKTEIALRKLAKRLTDINQTLAIDDRPEVAEAIKSVEKMRSDLLMSLFK
jgi:hypothetical protein